MGNMNLVLEKTKLNKFISYNENNFYKIPQLYKLTHDQKEAIQVVSKVLPFKVNQYVLDELIDWDNVADDSIFNMVFPQRDMLSVEDYNKLKLILKKNDACELQKCIFDIRSKLNPHPGDQMTLNVPMWQGERLEGVQHKYKQTLLYFPAQAQTCHSYCTFCFRWPQFIGDKSLKFSSKHINRLIEYLKCHKEITDVLITGGDPLISSTNHLRSYIEPLLDKNLSHITHIRIGTKVLSYWPHRFVTDKDADELLNLFMYVKKKGKHIAVMAHYNHFREMQTEITKIAIHRLQNAHVIIRTQAPVLKHINDTSTTWVELWKQQVKLGMIPYYMFIERDTGAKDYFSVPLIRALEIYTEAYKMVSGLCRTARGPVMSTSEGKVIVEDIVQIHHQKYFALKFIQARDENKVGKLFFAKYNPTASWINDLEMTHI